MQVMKITAESTSRAAIFFLLVTQHTKAFSFSTGVNLVIKCTMQMDKKMTLQVENYNKLSGTLSKHK
jgi:hypothetical protein